MYGKPVVDEFTATVTRVSDGDTIIVQRENEEPITVRLESVDAPEGEEPFSQLALDALEKLVQGREIQLFSTGKDGRGRTLAFARLGDLDVNSYLIENGFARHFKRYSNDPELAKLETDARERGLNIWAPPEPPADLQPYAIEPPEAELAILAWNVESGGADIAVIAEQLKQLSGYSIYGLCEVEPAAVDRFQQALGDDYGSIKGTHKSNDLLQMLYSQEKLELVNWDEMDELAGLQMNKPERTMRSPLWARFRLKETGWEFQVVLNHLARGDASFRQQQARGLREWARQQTLPTICIGDFNFDYVFDTEKGNTAFEEFLQDNVWQWIQPVEWIDSNWYDEDKDGQDDYPGSLLDFVFVAGPARDLAWKCSILVREGDFPDDARTSDHRPVSLLLETETGPEDPGE